jgi:6-pyruvoyltetrahydropterin/6-carboxytetrahydropterin synthase
MFEVTVEDEFSAVHYLKLYDGSWEPRHGHQFKVAVTARASQLDSMGVVVDFEWLKPELKQVLSELHEKSFNDHPDFKDKRNTSTENIAKFIHDRLSRGLRSEHAKIAKVTVWETPDAQASYLP